MNDEHFNEQLHEWARHTDSTMWTLGGILAGSLGGFAVFVSQHPSTRLGIVGLLFTIAAGYLIESFRATRRQIQMRLPANIVAIIRPPKYLKQWPVFLAIFLFLIGVWINIIYSELALTHTMDAFISP